MSELVIPLDAAQVAAAERGQQRVKVAVRDASGKITSQVVKVDPGKAEAKLKVDGKQSLTLAVGPENVSDEELFNLQTINTQISPNQWAGKDKLALGPIIITPIWWGLWLRWCRTFTIQGRVVCADGSPVPGAEVHALDVDFFWWWSSISQVGPTVITDATGHFTIKFRWCCGWWPWWWWRARRWSLNPHLIDKIRPILKLNPALRFPEPSPVVSFNLAALNPQPLPPLPLPGGTLPVTTAPISPTLGPTAGTVVDPSTIPALRDRLIKVLPQVPELERLRIWPWFPWTPWLDCSPDIIFRVTQNCGGQNKVIVNENIFQTRFDIPTNLTVTLKANDEACCIPQHTPDPVGDCALITGVCGDPGIIAGNIGGNSAHPAGPDGYANPASRDNPFSEAISIWGQLGISSQSDYYEIEYKPHTAPPTAWASVPPAALAGFSRGYFDSTVPWPNQWFYPGFPLKPLGTKLVYESRHHYETTHPPANWGSVFGRAWFMNVNELASIQTFGNFPDGTYDFRVRGYKSLANGDPDPNDPGVVLAGCGNHQENNLLVLRIDNRIVGPQQPGTVHIDTTEPDCGINFVKLGNITVQPCGAEKLQPNTPFHVDFFCSDPDGHLDHYELKILWGLGNVRNLLTVPGATLTGAGGVQPGPDYSNALAQGAVRPTWKGGNMHLTIPNAALVFPVTCCYLVELTVWKRNIVNCGNSYYNQMHYSFTVTV